MDRANQPAVFWGQPPQANLPNLDVERLFRHRFCLPPSSPGGIQTLMYPSDNSSGIVVN